MIDMFTQTQPMQADARLRMPLGAFERTAMICADAEVYTKGTTVFADQAASAAVRPHALPVAGTRSWSPPV